MARAALRRHLHNDTPAMLTRDHDAALGLLLAQAIAEACLALIPYAGDCTTDADGEITAVELRGTPARAAEIRIALEAAVAACVLQSAFEGADDGYAARLRDEYTALIGRVRRMCGDSTPPTLRPCWY